MSTVALTESGAVATLTERAAAFYGGPVEQIGLVITSVEQDTVEEVFTLCDSEPIRTGAWFSVEGYAYVKGARR